MKSTDLIGFAIAAVVLLVEYWGTRKIVVPNRFIKFLLAIVLPIVVLIVAVILQPKYYILGIVGIICLFSIPILLSVSNRNKDDFSSVFLAMEALYSGASSEDIPNEKETDNGGLGHMFRV